MYVGISLLQGRELCDGLMKRRSRDVSTATYSNSEMCQDRFEKAPYVGH